MKFMEEYLRICERVYIVSTTIHLDKGYEHMKQLIKKKYQDEDVDIEDAQDNPFHDDLTALPMIVNGMIKRTREAQDQGDSHAPLTLVLLDDVAAGSGSSGTRYNEDVLRLFTQSRHSGGVILLLTQSYTLLNRSARLQATHVAVWAVQETQWIQIRDELAGRQGMSREELDAAWRTATSRPHGFLWIAYNAPPGSKFWSGFTKNCSQVNEGIDYQSSEEWEDYKATGQCFAAACQAPQPRTPSMDAKSYGGKKPQFPGSPRARHEGRGQVIKGP